MAFLEAQALRAYLFLVLAASALAGAFFAGYAVFLALLGALPPAWAAAVAGLLLLAIPFAAAIVVRGRAAGRTAVAPPARESPDVAAVGMIAGLAKDKPLLAVLFAGLLGAAGTLIQQKGRVH